LNKASYDDTREYFAGLGRRNRGITSIIEFGTRRASGLSDIDIMIIVESEASIAPNAGWSDMNSYPQAVKRHMDGGAVKIVTEDQYTQLPLLGSMNVNAVYGELVDQVQFDDQQQHLIHIADIMDWLAERIVTLNSHVRSQGAHATRAINCAYSITHTFSRAVNTGASKESIGRDYQEAVDTFRNQWRESPIPIEHTLVPWLEDRLEDALNLSALISGFVTSRGYYTPPKDAESSSFRFNNGTLGFHIASQHGSANLLQGGRITTPGVWLSHFAFQSKLPGRIAGEIAKRIDAGNAPMKAQLAPDLQNLLTKRMALCNSIADMLLPKGMRDNIYRFGHLLSPAK